MFAKFDEIPSMILQDIKETKRYGHTDGRSFGRSVGRSDNVKTVYPPTNKVCGGGGGGYNKQFESMFVNCTSCLDSRDSHLRNLISTSN